MKHKIPVLIFLPAFFMLCTAIPLNAQPGNADSTIVLLNKSKTKNGIDSADFEAALDRISAATLDDAAIGRIEKAAAEMDRKGDEYCMYNARLAILSALSFTHPYKAISYGKDQVAQLEQSRKPYAGILRINFLFLLRIPYRNTDKLSEGFQYYTGKLRKYKSENDSAGMATVYYVFSGFYSANGLLDQAIYNMKKSLSYMDTTHMRAYGSLTDRRGIDIWRNNTVVMAGYSSSLHRYEEALGYLRMILHSSSDPLTIAVINLRIASVKLAADRVDSVAYHLSEGKKFTNIERTPFRLQLEGLYNIKTGRLDEAEKILTECVQVIRRDNIPVFTGAGVIDPEYYLAMIRMRQKRYTDAIAFLKADITRLGNRRLEVLRDYKLLADLYEKTGAMAPANAAYKRYTGLQDSLLADQALYSNISFETEKEMAEKELAISQLQNDNRVSSLIRNFSFGIGALLLALTALVYFRYRSKMKANKALEKTLADLRSTQQQLIQSEKMASLGELTAGIAHEIQNPLNFVNNFSEVSVELVDELRHEAATGNKDEVIAIAENLNQNLLKITHHGKRADAIVKGMLQHSRAGTGKKELTDINALIDEYLRLSYHGLKAKDKSFNAGFKTDLDKTIGKIEIVPQDMGRVLLSLFNNAFYAAAQKQKSAGGSFEPMVEAGTKKRDGKVEITVRDNGTGIPRKALDKIFQPFFTTKPTGEGTGLGLSLSYDIVTKGHGGDIEVRTEEGEGSLFVVRLPAMHNSP